MPNGLFRRLGDLFRGKKPAAASDPVDEDEREKKPPAAPAPRASMLLHEAITANDHVAALRILREGRDGADEGELVEAALSALGPAPQRDEIEESPVAASPGDPRDELLLLLAEVLVARGARKKACEVLSRARSPSALVLRADLLVEGVEGVPLRDDLDRALALLSRALVLDIDAPGARDRWERLRNRLGHAEEARGPSIGVTLVAKGASIPFVLLREVARGGAGVVYEARETLGDALVRTVALKMAHTDRTRDRVTRAQLAHEARVAAQFRGPGVVPILDVDVDEGWLAMAWAAGTSLRARLRDAKGDDPLAASPTWLARLVSTLADVHAEGWVHGDVKPANVLFDARDRPLFGDFGLARRSGEPNTPGSAGYVAPERSAGAACSPFDDVYGIGKLLHDVLGAGWCAPDAERLRAIADACIAPIEVRPKDARAVLSLLG